MLVDGLCALARLSLATCELADLRVGNSLSNNPLTQLLNDCYF